MQELPSIDIIKLQETAEETVKDYSPECFDQFIGQKALKEKLHVYTQAAKMRDEAVDHLLFSGPPGLGKTTLANIIAKTMGTKLVVTSGPVIEKPSDLAGILTNLQTRDILFIDEIHRLPKAIEEYLYAAMEDFTLDLLIDSGPNARSVQIKLNPFTLIGATTRSGLLSNPMRSRFVFNARLDYYPAQHLQKIIQRSAQILSVTIDHDGSDLIAKRARGTPRIANNLLRWVRDYSQMNNTSSINDQIAKKALEMLAIDEMGLDEMDKKIINVIIDNYNGGPVGIKTISVAVGEEPTTIAEVYEPFLVMHGFINRTLRGREATRKAYEHMGREYPSHNSGDKG